MNPKNIAREVGAFAFFLALAILLTWPLAIRLSSGVSDPGDPLLNAWILDWDCYALLHQPLHLFSAPMYAPAHLTLAYSEHMVGVAIFLLPFHLLGANAIALHSLAMLLGFTMSGYGAWVLARMVSRSSAASLAAGIFHAYVGFRISHLPHVQIVNAGWVPLILAGMIAVRRNPTRRNALLFGAAFAMNGLTNIYFLMFSIVAVAMTFWLFAIAGTDRLAMRRIVFALIGAGIVLLPFLAPYAIVSSEYHMQRMYGEALSGSASWLDWLIPAPNNLLWWRVINPDLSRAERYLFPGLLPLILFAFAFWSAAPPAPLSHTEPRPRRTKLDIAIALVAILSMYSLVAPVVRLGFRRFTLFEYTGADIPLMLLLILLIVRFTPAIRARIAQSRFGVDSWAALVWIVVGFVGSFGLNGFFAEFLFRRMQIFRSMRALARFAEITYAGLAVWMALGAAALLASVRRPAWRALLGVLLIVAALVDVSPDLRWVYMNEAPSPADLWLKDHRNEIGGSTLELPMNNWGTPFLYLLGDTLHHTPIMNGTSGFEPPVHRKLREADEKLKFDDDFLKTIENNGCALVLVHADWAGRQGPPIAEWIKHNLASHRMTFVRRFDHGIYGDWLFAVTRNARVRGVTSDPNLTRLLNGQATYNASTFGRMDRPRPGSTIEGELLVTGWTLSPYGIRSATVLIDAGRIRVPAVLTPRADITNTWPWYPRSPWPAFTAHIARPLHLEPYTDVQVEIVDQRGVATRFTDVEIQWK